MEGENEEFLGRKLLLRPFPPTPGCPGSCGILDLKDKKHQEIPAPMEVLGMGNFI